MICFFTYHTGICMAWSSPCNLTISHLLDLLVVPMPQLELRTPTNALVGTEHRQVLRLLELRSCGEWPWDNHTMGLKMRYAPHSKAIALYVICAILYMVVNCVVTCCYYICSRLWIHVVWFLMINSFIWDCTPIVGSSMMAQTHSAPSSLIFLWLPLPCPIQCNKNDWGHGFVCKWGTPTKLVNDNFPHKHKLTWPFRGFALFETHIGIPQLVVLRDGNPRRASIREVRQCRMPRRSKMAWRDSAVGNQTEVAQLPPEVAKLWSTGEL